LQIKSKDKDGYTAVQIGFEKIKESKVTKSKKTKPFKHLREFKNNISDYELGKELNVSMFEEGEKVKIAGTSKGKGFAGGVKKWGFAGLPSTRGTRGTQRTIGSIGASTPSRVTPGRKMPGRMGGERVTVKNLKVIKVDPANNVLMVKGAVPGARGTLLEIRSVK
jgi:large subunit ribosomal protein L3